MIAALSLGGRILRNEKYTAAAEKAVHFIQRTLVREDGRLLARYRDGSADYPGYIDDYAFLVWGLIELYQTTFKTKYLREAERLNESMIRLFWDKERGGFFFYGEDGEQLIARPKEIYDGATPSGNSVASFNLLRLAKMIGNEDWNLLAEKQLKAFAGKIPNYPIGFSHFLMALMFALGPEKILI
ncbi:hypothetical protein L1765_03650 [Microaerobacter geothermalis]|uniref:hypothetical protein n=1 Tax=Microaerobacter geothermalis TaxID=674972 RepID=UPI001F38BCE8|nr:hypothetical protein [Microaerobacter geothermalis]MCF6093088.1 hypothetical protein [Microaerobacter geothermalis]